MNTILNICSFVFTGFGFVVFLYGLFLEDTDAIQTGLLSMILGELIDVPKRKFS